MHDPAKVDCAGGEPTAVDAPASAVFTGQGAPDTPAQGRFATVTELPSTLHPATIWLPSLEAVLGPLMPALFGSLFIGLNAVLLLLLVFVMLPTAAYHSLRYFTLRYQISESELVVQSGLVFRRERRIPYDRVQETEIKQSIIHRLLGLAKVSITTAGSNAREAGLNVLTRTAAEVLKESISSKQQLAVAHEASPAASGETAEIVCQLGIGELLLGGISSKLVASLGAVAAAIVYFKLFLWLGDGWRDMGDDIAGKMPLEAFEGLEDLGPQPPNLGPFDFVVDLFLVETFWNSIMLAALGLMIAMGTYIVQYHGFRLTRDGEFLNTSYGLLTLHHGSLARDRIQALKLEEGLLRRRLGLASIRVDSAGDRDELDDRKKRDVLVPVISRRAAQAIAEHAISGLKNLEPAWLSISPRSVMRGSKKGWLLTILLITQTYLFAGWYCWVWLPAIPFVYFVNYQWYLNTGYWFNEKHFLFRKGWLNRSTVCLPIGNIQNISVSQSFFDRRHDLARLSIDTAGQSNTGGGPRIRHLPVAEAQRIQQTLSSLVADSEFNW